MLVFFAWVIWFWILIRVLADVFRRHDISGCGKAAWTLFVIVVPFLGVPIYLIVNGQDLGKRDVEEAQTSPAHFDEYIRSISGSGGTAAEIEKPKQLLDSGAITQAEFDALKAKAVG